MMMMMGDFKCVSAARALLRKDAASAKGRERLQSPVRAALLPAGTRLRCVCESASASGSRGA
jgi:hypothetical protein